MLYSFSNASAEDKDHVDCEESFFLFLEAETTIFAFFVNFGEEQSKPTPRDTSTLLVKHPFRYVESRTIEVGSREEGSLYMTTPARCPEKHVVYLPSLRDTLHLLMPIFCSNSELR